MSFYSFYTLYASDERSNSKPSPAKLQQVQTCCELLQSYVRSLWAHPQISTQAIEQSKQ